MNKLKKVLSVILCLSMLMTVLPGSISAAADETGINTGGEVNLKSVTQGVTATANTAGVGGKAADDVVIKYDVPAEKNGGLGNDYIAINPIKQGEDFYAEFSVMMPEGITEGAAKELRVGFNYFTTEEKSDSARADCSLLSIKGDYVRLQNATGTELLAIEGGKWYTFGLYVPQAGDNATVYVNGVSYSVLLPETFFGVRAGRLFPRNKDNTEAFSFYMDNIRDYSQATSTVYDPMWDKAPVLTAIDSTAVILADGSIECSGGITAKALKAKLNADGANIRIYNEDLTTQLSDTDTVADGSVVVVAAANGFANERAYSYYSVKTIAVDETGINTGSEVNLKGASGGEITASANTAGIGGKEADDVVVKYDVPAGINGGFGTYYIALSPTKQGEDNYFAEFSVMMPEGITDGNAKELRVGLNYFTAEDKSTNDNYSLLSIKSDYVRVGSSTGTELLAIEGGKWYTFGIHIPSAGGNATVYINGEALSVLLPETFYGVRDGRLFARNKDNTEAFSFYMDNMRGYSASSKITYNPKWDKAAELSSADEYVTIDEANVISCPDAITADELIGKLNAGGANIRIYDAAMTKELSGNDTVPTNAMLVAASTNGFTDERVYSYYKVVPVKVNDTAFEVSVNEDGKTCTVTAFLGEKVDEKDIAVITIPETIMGYTVTAIGDNAFYNNSDGTANEYTKKIESVILPDTVETIGERAFAARETDGGTTGSIRNVTLSKNLKKIGYNAFARQTELEYITLPEGLEEIGQAAFYWTGLKEIVIPDSVTTVGQYVFNLCNYLEYVKLSCKMTSIPQGFFQYCTSIKEIVVPSSVTTVSNHVFGYQTTETPMDASNVVVYGVSGTGGETFADKWGFKFVANEVVVPIRIYGDGVKKLIGSDYDLDYGYKTLEYIGSIINIGGEPIDAVLKLAMYDGSGTVVSENEKEISLSALSSMDIESGDLSILADGLADGYSVKATLKDIASGEDIIEPIEIVMDKDKQEVHVLHIANSFGNDSFAYIHDIAKADGVTIKTQNMYIGGASLKQHYENISGNLANYQPVVDNLYLNEKISVKEALDSDKWSVVALQAATHGKNSDFEFIGYTYDNGYVQSNLRDTYFEYITEYVSSVEPEATRVMHMSWTPCEDQAKALVGGKVFESRNDAFLAHEAAYKYGSLIYSTKENMMVPTSYAIEYALNVLGYSEHSGEVSSTGGYTNPVDGEISLFRDETCHLTTPYGRVLAGLCWYEYLTGNDARENPYTHADISETVMAQLKEAAHYANTKVTRLDGTVYEEPTEAKDAKISVKVAGGSANVLVDGVDKGSALFVATYPVGTALTYTAVPEDENQVFLYWYDAESKVILSTEETTQVTVGSDAEYVAVYADKTDEIYVTFKSNKRILAAGLKDAIDIPEDPYMTGYTFMGWYDENGNPTAAALDVSENTVYTAGFKANTAKYTVTVTGADEEGGEYAYNEKVTLNAKEPEEGLVFTHWTRDGKTVSYSKTYSFYISSDTTVTANYSEAALEEQIVLVMANPTVVGTNSDKIAFYAERNIPEKYTVVESGILVSRADSFDINSTGIIKAKATSTANIGQYTIRKANVKSGETWYAKAYLIYSDGEQTYTTYSDMVSKTL